MTSSVSPEWAARAAETGTKLIVLDDDWRMNAHGAGIFSGCMCPEHVRRYSELAREELGREDFSADPEPIGEDPGPIREDERSLLRYYRELDGTRKEKVVDYAADQWSLQKMERTAPEDGPGHIQN